MRKVLLLTTLVVFGVAGVAYGAVSNVYVVRGKISPLKSGTKAHPVPISTTISYTVTTVPKGQRPNIVKTLQITVQGVQAHTNDFKACSTSRLNDPTEGPSTCPKGSLIGSGYFIAEIGPSSSQKTVSLTCRADVKLYNGGAGTLSYYAYARAGVKGECPLTPMAFAATVKNTAQGLQQTINIPAPIRHPGATTDAAAIKAVVSVPLSTTKVKGKTVGLTESIACPVNHQRQIKVRFTLENGKAQLVTRDVPCK